MDIWTYRETTWSTENLVGFSVEALDGGIGKIDAATNEVSASYIVVDTGPWIFGKKVMLPARCRAQETLPPKRATWRRVSAMRPAPQPHAWATPCLTLTR